MASIILSHSRFRIFHLKSQNTLLSLLTETFEAIGGVPAEILTDNMKTVMDEVRTDYQLGKVNAKFDQFAKDFGFKVRPCIVGRPRKKGKLKPR